MDNKIKVVLSPLAGVTDKSFRQICSGFGLDYSYTEMVSAKGLLYGDKKSKELLDSFDGERCGVQIFGSDPEIISKVIREDINKMNFESIDFNMGCPAPKIVKNGEGSALMKEPEKVKRIISAMREATDLPISAKFRLGFDENSINYLEIGRICEEYGANKVTLHGRTRKQMYSGRADWQAIKNLRQELKIDVVANGDIFTPEDAKKIVLETGVKEIAIARGAMGNPFLFRQIKDYFKTGVYKKTEFGEVIDTIIAHYELLLTNKRERIAINEMRKNVSWYIKGFRGSNTIKNKINKMNNYEDILNLLLEYKMSLETYYEG